MKFDEKDVFNNVVDVAREYINIMDDDLVTLEVSKFVDYLAKAVGIDIPISSYNDNQTCEIKVDDEVISQVLYNMIPMYTKGDKDKMIFLTGLLNYISKRKYTSKELGDRYEEIDHEKQLHDLKRFLGRTSKYSAMFKEGMTLEEVYAKYSRGYGFTDDNGIFHYDIKYVYDTEETEMLPHVQEDLNEEFYAMAYAYAKSGRVDTMPEVIEERVEEMRTR